MPYFLFISDFLYGFTTLAFLEGFSRYSFWNSLISWIPLLRLLHGFCPRSCQGFLKELHQELLMRWRLHDFFQAFCHCSIRGFLKSFFVILSQISPGNPKMNFTLGFLSESFIDSSWNFFRDIFRYRDSSRGSLRFSSQDDFKDSSQNSFYNFFINSSLDYLRIPFKIPSLFALSIPPAIRPSILLGFLQFWESSQKIPSRIP